MRFFHARRAGCTALSLLSLSFVAEAQALTEEIVDGDPLGNFRVTFYYVVPEADYPAELPLDASVRDMEDREIARVPAAFRKAMDIEGTGRLRDGKVVNFAGVKDREIRYAETVHPDGRGAGNCPLAPYRTIAVDRNRIPLGSVVLIRETVGMKLPDGTLHDGLWRAEDVGGAIRQDRIDLFVGDGRRGGDVLLRHGITHLQPLTVTRVSPPAEANCTQQPPQ